MSVILCLFGPSGSGKTYWKSYFISRGILNIKSFTTRKKRNKEDDEYFFVSKKTFNKLQKEHMLININENYHGEKYGIHIKDLCCGPTEKGIQILITDITSIKTLKKELKSLDKKPIFIYCIPPEDYEEKLMSRGTPERIEVAKQELEYFKDNLPKKSIYYLETITDAERILKKVYKNL